jgi:hypothetical protein
MIWENPRFEEIVDNCDLDTTSWFIAIMDQANIADMGMQYAHDILYLGM